MMPQTQPATNITANASTVHTEFRTCDCDSEKPHGYFWASFEGEEMRIPIMIPSITAGKRAVQVFLENEKILESDVGRLEAELAAAGLPEIARSEEEDTRMVDIQIDMAGIPPKVAALLELLGGGGVIVGGGVIGPDAD